MLTLVRSVLITALVVGTSCLAETEKPKLVPDELPSREQVERRPVESSGWFILKAGEGHSQATSDGTTLGLSLIGLEPHSSCYQGGCFTPGSVTATVDHEVSDAVPLPPYMTVQNGHFTYLEDGNLVDFDSAATTTEGGPWYGKFRLRTVSPVTNATLGSSYLLEAASPISFPAESIRIWLAAVEFETLCSCMDPCGDRSCLCVVGTSLKTTAFVQTSSGSELLVLPASFGGYTFSGTPRAGMCYSEIPYLSGFNLQVSKP